MWEAGLPIIFKDVNRGPATFAQIYDFTRFRKSINRVDTNSFCNCAKHGETSGPISLTTHASIGDLNCIVVDELTGAVYA